MISKTIKYTDYNGTEREETFYFHLNQAELTKWLMTSGDYTLDKVLQRLSTERNGKKIMEIFDDLLQKSYGRPSLDGRRFEKSKELWEDFQQTEAYSVLFSELVYDAEKAAKFINGIIPSDLSEKIISVVSENPEAVPDHLKEYVQPLIVKK